MTTPPDALPPEVARDLIVDADTFDISDGIPEALGTLDPLADFGIDEGTASNDSGDGGFDDLDMALNESGNSQPEFNSPTGFETLDGEDTSDEPQAPADTMPMDSINRSFADVPSSATDNLANESESFSMSDLDSPAANLQASRLPEVTPGSSTPIQLNPNQEYTSTGATYSAPDPNTAVASIGSSDAPASISPAAESDPIAAAGLSNAIATADRQYHSDRRREALATLSLFYETPNLTSEQRDELLSRLDPLAAEVIYSSEHLLAEPHRVAPNETLMDIAEKYEVPWQLLANING
ncbi:MAG: peptigoglycan-binding protein LysM, partial [Rhodopirellula sp. JB055]|uniref:peptigoglycan-binding protein LysM n=1 Tax=Rhodopirellula sp. JB055 TaxID=3342846 RepID=UPI00370C03E4